MGQKVGISWPVLHSRTVMSIRLRAIYASTSGHTEYVVQALSERLGSQADVVLQRAEQAQLVDLRAGDILLLASGTWNTGGVEGQLNPHMHALLHERADQVDLTGLPCLAIGLGDSRYRYTANAAVHLGQFVTDHGGTMLLPALKIVDEPYDRLDDVLKPWLDQLSVKLTTFAVA